MMQRYGYLIAVLCTLSFYSFVGNVHAKTLAQTQQALNTNLIELKQAHESEQAFLEDVLRRKNDHFRERLLSQLPNGDEQEKINSLIFDQINLVQGLLSFSENKLSSLAKEARASTGAENLALQLEFQQRIITMNSYYQQLHETIQTAERYRLDVDSIRQQFSQSLLKRAEFLANAILFIDTKRQAATTRLAYVSEEDKQALSQDITRYNERISMATISLESGMAIMESMGTDVTEYKQLLLNITGDINADILDMGVALGLLEQWLDSLKQWLFNNTPSIVVKILLFLFILYVTRSISRLVSSAVRKSVQHSQMNFSVLMQDFFVSIASKAVIFIGLLFAASQVGIQLAPLLTGFGVAGLIIGFALQDTLSNFASGLMILIYRPFDVGDMVNVSGIQGTVKKMSLVSTTVQTIDNQRLVIPNNKIWGDVINNITAETIRRVDMVFGIGYADDIDAAKQVLMDILINDPRILKDPEPVVKLHTLNESSVDFVVRPWVNTEDYWEVYWDVTEAVKKALDEANISIPFPQRDIHVYHQNIASNEDEQQANSL